MIIITYHTTYLSTYPILTYNTAYLPSSVLRPSWLVLGRAGTSVDNFTKMKTKKCCEGLLAYLILCFK